MFSLNCDEGSFKHSTRSANHNTEYIMPLTWISFFQLPFKLQVDMEPERVLAWLVTANSRGVAVMKLLDFGTNPFCTA